MTDEAPWPQMDKGRPVVDPPPADADEPAELTWKQPPISVFDRIKGVVLGRSADAPQVDPVPVDPAPAAQPVDQDAAAAEATDASVDAAADEWGEEMLAPEALLAPAAPPRPCRQCGGVVDADGYCTQCGARAPSEREHFEETPASWVGAVCDRGVRHVRNEDGMATAALPGWGSHAVLVVCDGVTTSDDSDVASLAAARAARDLLAAADLAAGSSASHHAAVASALTRAAAVANDAVIELTKADAVNPPACTFVAAVVDGDRVTVGNVGDSRAYWMPDAGEGRILTRDDSLAEDSIASGVPRKAAEEAADAHTITRWLGVDADDVLPHVAVQRVAEPGWLLVCSDGLWNYASEPAEVSTALRGAVAATSGAPVDVARALVDWANAQGGHDNVTVCLARLGVAEPVPEKPLPSSDTVRIRRLPAADEDAAAVDPTADEAAEAAPDPAPAEADALVPPTAAGLQQAHEAANAALTEHAASEPTSPREEAAEQATEQKASRRGGATAIPPLEG